MVPTLLKAAVNMLVRMVDEHGILGDNGLAQATVVTKSVEVPRWRRKDETIMRVCIR